jgi:hypothetical protein
MSRSLDQEQSYFKMVAELAKLSSKRYHSAILEGKTEQRAFEEVVAILLEGYKQATAS